MQNIVYYTSKTAKIKIALTFLPKCRLLYTVINVNKKAQLKQG